MGERKRLGIFLKYNKNALGEIIYILNFVKCLNLLDDDKKPHIVLFYSFDLFNYINELNSIDYKFIEFVQILRKHSRTYLYLYSIISMKNQFTCSDIKQHKLDYVFPILDFPIANKYHAAKHVAWIPDFQHLFLPQYFSKLNLFLRNLRFKLVAKRADYLILSSFDAYNHFKENYNFNSNLKICVLQFLSFVKVPELNFVERIKLKYGINKPYFMIANQFYEHKDHLTVFKAISSFKKYNNNISFVFTGRMADYRNPSYINKLKNYILQFNLNENCHFLGVIERTEQIALMSSSLAIIQPSMFEGWSTVNEDAKSLNKLVLASDINVNIEQMSDNALFFKVSDSHELLNLLEFVVSNPSFKNISWDCQETRGKKFANDFMNFILN